MTFHEYLIAMGKEPMAAHIMKSQANVSPQIQQMILGELKIIFCGGMPECVQTWCDTASMLEAFKVQSEILDSYRDDFAKYTPRVDTTCLDAVFLNLAQAVGEQIKYTRLNQGHTSPTNKKAFELLMKARLVQKIPAANPSGLPLGATANAKNSKPPWWISVYSSDCVRSLWRWNLNRKIFLPFTGESWQSSSWPRNCWH